MALRRVFVDWVEGGAAGVGGARAHHLARVARLRVGESVEISDQQRLFLAQVKSAAARQVEFEIVEPLATPARPFPLVVQAAIFKFARFEWIVEKAAELGVRTIVPVMAAHTERGLAAAAGKRRERWQKIADEAAQQSRQLCAPAVEEPVSFAEAVGAADGPLRLFLDTDSPALRDVLAGFCAAGASAYLLVGPEGGWSDAEREQARAAGYQAAGLGPVVLRAETAALAAAAIVSHLLGERSSAAGGGAGTEPRA